MFQLCRYVSCELEDLKGEICKIVQSGADQQSAHEANLSWNTNWFLSASDKALKVNLALIVKSQRIFSGSLHEG